MLPRAERRSGFRLEAGRAPAEVLERLRSAFAAEVRGVVRRRAVFYDTFDRRLARRGSDLIETVEGGRRRLEWTRERGPRVRAATATGRVDFAQGLPAGLRDAVARIAGPRRLLPTLELDGETTEIDVLDPRAKTVARVRLVDGRCRDPLAPGDWRELPPLLWVAGLRGYEREFDEVCGVLREDPALRPAEADLQAWAAGGAVPEDPSTWRPELPADVRADVGLRRILRVHLRQMLAYEAGLRADLDVEFLHDFRVAVRRMRSLLALVKRVLPADVVERTRGELAWLGRMTGPVRDLDVLRLDLDGRPEPPARADLERVLGFVAREREVARRALVRALDSRRYRAFVLEWQTFLDLPQPARPFAKHSHRTLREVVARRILDIDRRIRRRGRRIGPETPAAALHELRIDCKKMRYLVDGTRELWGSEARRVVRRLRKLQNVLGSFNDCRVQEERLTRIGERMAAERAAPASTLLALGRIVEQLDVRAVRVREKFGRRFQRFDDARTRKAVARAFAPEGDA